MSTAIRNQIEQWQKRGIIDNALAKRLVADLAENPPEPPKIPVYAAGIARPKRRFSFFQVVVTFAAICFCAAIALFISANWDVIPRIAKVAAIFAIMAFGFVGGVFAHRRQSAHSVRIEEALYLIAGGAYVGGIALVGQMYHIPGDLASAMLVFATGLGLAGLLVRSYVLVIGGLGALVWWYLSLNAPEMLLSWEFALVLAGCGVAWLFGSMRSSRLMRILAIAALGISLLPFGFEVLEWLIDVYESIPEQVRLTIWLIVFALSVTGLLMERYRPETLRGLPLLKKPRIGLLFAIMLVSLFALHILFERGDALALPAALGIVASLVVLFAHGKDEPALRYCSYGLFGLEVGLLYMVTLSTLLSTSGFFFAIGLFLTVLALIIWRFEKRFAAQNGDAS